MISLTTIVLFFLYLWGLGFTAIGVFTAAFKKPENLPEKNFLERNFVYLGLGLGIFPILSIILNFLHLPLDWKLFLLLSLAYPFYFFSRKAAGKGISFSSLNTKKLSGLKITKSSLVFLAVLLIAAASLSIYLSGAFSYPYLEDEDPWGHAIGVKYIAREKTAYDPPLKNMNREIDPVLSYMDPYPPAYEIMLGVLHQTSPDLAWTLKFFNALIISLGFIFFYLFAKGFMGNRYPALFATFALAVIPCYLSHFIWAHSLAVTLFFPAMYALEKLRENKKWFLPSVLIIASLWVSQNVDQPLKLSVMFLIYMIVISITQRKFFARHFAALISGFALSLFWWGTMLYKYGLKGFASYYNIGSSYAASAVSDVATSRSWNLLEALKSLVAPGGSASRAYLFRDFFVANTENYINNPIGIGMVLSLLVILSVAVILWKKRSRLVTKENTWQCVALFWLIFTFWGVNGQTFPVSIARGPFRVWMLLAITAALVSAEGLNFLISERKKITKWLIVLAVLIGLIGTSGYQKYSFNTMAWPTSGSFASGQEVLEYAAWFGSIPLDSRVFLYSPRDKLTLGFGAFSCAWCQEVLDFRQRILDKDAVELHRFLKSQQYEYFLINGRMDSKYFNSDYGEETERRLNERYSQIIHSGLFTPVHQRENLFIVFKVN